MINKNEEENLEINNEENKLINNFIFYSKNNLLTKSYNFFINLNNITKKNKNIILLLICIFIIYEIKLDYLYYFNYKIKQKNEIIRNNKNEYYLKVSYIRKFNSFINICLKGKLKEERKYPLLKNPKISVIMPIYNGGKYLFYSLRSIQNQKMKEIEIILIDDYSTDDSLNIIKNYMKEDPRIKLIKNNKNRKILYSKSLAALNSNGKYIIELDQDDMFITDDCFNILYYEAETNNLDLVHIRDISKNNFKFKYQTQINLINEHLIYPQETNFKSQPTLKEKMFIENNIYLLWGLLIKTNLYKKTIYYLWPVITKYQLIFHEDYAISFMLVVFAERYKYLNQFAILHLVHQSSASSNYIENKNYYLSVLFVSNLINEYYLKNNPKDIKILVNYITLFIDCFQYAKKYYPDLFKYIIKNILNSDYLSNKEKVKIINKIENNNNTYSIEELNKKYNYFIKISNYKSNSLIHDISDTNSLVKYSPEITIIIYCNEYLYLDKTIKSVLNQRFKNIEIIIIYDNNDSQSLSLIKNYIKYYKIITLIDNKNIKGLLYSISIGIMNSKGKYILLLQSGYTLFKDKILEELNYISINNNQDIIEFNLLINESENIKYQNLYIYKCIHIKSSINTDSIKYNKLNREIDQGKELLFNKFIKTNLLKEVIKNYKFINYKDVIYNYYDNIIIFSLIKNNIKFEYINITGIIQNNKQINKLKITKLIKDQNQLIKDTIFYINFLYDKTDGTYEGKKYALNEFYNLLSLIYNKFNKISNDSIKLFEKFNNSKLIDISDKKELNFYYNSLIN